MEKLYRTLEEVVATKKAVSTRVKAIGFIDISFIDPCSFQHYPQKRPGLAIAMQTSGGRYGVWWNAIKFS
jgi:hypothetical protein